MKKITYLLMLLLAQSAFAGEHSNQPSIDYKEIKLTKNVSMLMGKGGNLGIIKGDDGLLIIDDQYKANIDSLTKALGDFGGAPAFIINTHWHGDHTGGNTVLGKTGTIVAHTNVRKRLNSPQEIKFFKAKFPTQPKSALPVVTFDESLSLHFNGQELKLVHYPAGHTDGDSVVFIQPANVVHMGDHYFSGMFPFIDLDSGGDVQGFTNNVKKIIARLPKDVQVIPGHGPLTDLAGLKEYHQMLVSSIKLVQKYIDKGLSLEQAQKKGMPVKWKKWGKGFINQDNWIMTVYNSLKAKK